MGSETARIPKGWPCRAAVLLKSFLFNLGISLRRVASRQQVEIF